MFSAFLATFLASALLMQERVEYPDNTYLVTGRFTGPGHYCDAGFRLRLQGGERVLFLNPLVEYHRLQIDLGDRRVDAFVGRRAAAGRRLGVSGLRQSRSAGGVSYYFPIGTSFVQFQSLHFRGNGQDGWFLERLEARDGTNSAPACLGAEPSR